MRQDFFAYSSENDHNGGEDKAENEHNEQAELAGLFHLNGRYEQRAVYKQQQGVGQREVRAQKAAEAEQQGHR